MNQDLIDKVERSMKIDKWLRENFTNELQAGFGMAILAVELEDHEMFVDLMIALMAVAVETYNSSEKPAVTADQLFQFLKGKDNAD